MWNDSADINRARLKLFLRQDNEKDEEDVLPPPIKLSTTFDIKPTGPPPIVSFNTGGFSFSSAAKPLESNDNGVDTTEKTSDGVKLVEEKKTVKSESKEEEGGKKEAAKDEEVKETISKLGAVKETISKPGAAKETVSKPGAVKETVSKAGAAKSALVPAVDVTKRANADGGATPAAAEEKKGFVFGGSGLAATAAITSIVPSPASGTGFTFGSSPPVAVTPASTIAGTTIPQPSVEIETTLATSSSAPKTSLFGATVPAVPKGASLSAEAAPIGSLSDGKAAEEKSTLSAGQNLFGANGSAQSQPFPSGATVPNQQATTAGAPTSIFGSSFTPSTTGASMFAASTSSIFGGGLMASSSSSMAASSPLSSSIGMGASTPIGMSAAFGSTPKASVFGGAMEPSTTAPSVFGSSMTAPSIFGSSTLSATSSAPMSSLAFGAASAPSEAPAFSFGGANDTTLKPANVFGSDGGDSAPQSVFGGGMGAPASAGLPFGQPPFGANAASQPAAFGANPPTQNAFGSTATPQPSGFNFQPSTNIFGGPPSTTPNFGAGAPPTPNPAVPSFGAAAGAPTTMFGSSQATPTPFTPSGGAGGGAPGFGGQPNPAQTPGFGMDPNGKRRRITTTYRPYFVFPLPPLLPPLLLLPQKVGLAWQFL